jgi:hypothetical protein
MNFQRHKIELFCWSSLLTLIVLSCAGMVPWWGTAGWLVAFSLLMRTWVWALQRGSMMFFQRYTLAAETIREHCPEGIARQWAFHDDEIWRSYRFDDDDDDEDGGEPDVCADPV